MNLADALRSAAHYLGLNAGKLVAYAAQDGIGGWDYDHYLYRWPPGSIFSVEGQLLYALTRALGVSAAADLGTVAGCSASHLAQALIDNDADGALYCVHPDRSAGHLILYERGAVLQFAHQDCLAWLLTQPDHSLDLIFDDTPKTVQEGAAIADGARRVLKPGGVYIAHDAAHFLIGRDIQEGLRLGGMDNRLIVLIDPADCGLAIWKKPE